jgi:hypothetical protein
MHHSGQKGPLLVTRKELIEIRHDAQIVWDRQILPDGQHETFFGFELKVSDTVDNP